MKKRLIFLVAILLCMAQSSMAWEGSGTEASPWLIRTDSDWQQIDDELKAGANFTYNVFRLDNDLKVTTFIGSSEEHPFTGTFDGGGYTLEINITSDEEAIGPFAAIRSATIRNLHVDGSLRAGLCSGGVVGKVYGSRNLVENCRMSATLRLKRGPYNGPHGGGIVGHGKQGGLTIRGCVFDGALIAESLDDSWMGGILGWCDSAEGMIVRDCMALGTFYCQNQSLTYDVTCNPTAVTTINSYYNCNKELTGQKKALSITSAEAFNLDFGEPIATYPMAGIKTFETGLEWNGTFYAGQGESITFNLTVKDGFQLRQAPVTNSGQLAVDGDTYTLTMGSKDAFINGDFIATADLQGSGTSDDPWLVSSSADWYLFSRKVADGNTFAGEVVRMTTDIDAKGVIVGDDRHPFQGTFDGDGHTLTINLGSLSKPVPTTINEQCAPFRYLKGATIRHLHTTGTYHTSAKFAGGIVSFISGDSPSKLLECSSDVIIFTDGSVGDDASNGGLVGLVESGGCSFVDCTFTGRLSGFSPCSGGFVGWTDVPLSFTRCIFDPYDQPTQANCATFVRHAPNVNCTFEECYHTVTFSTKQGETVFCKLDLPKGSFYEIEGEPTVKIGGKKYWKSGAYVTITAPENVNFDHWVGSCYMSDPWNRNGRHQLLDVGSQPSFSIETSMPKAADQETIWGVTYRYLSRPDYHLYVSDEHCQAHGWYLNGNGRLVAKDKDNDEYYITAIVDHQADKLTHSLVGGFWGLSMEYEGTVIVNDLVSDTWNHTHLGVIAPRAFKGCSTLEKIIFVSDRDALHRQNLLGMDLIISEEAFANCPNLREFIMMYYNYTGTDHWETIAPTAVTAAYNAFDNSKQCTIYVDPSLYQDYLSSTAWAPNDHLIGLYMITEEDFTVNGAIYSYMRDNNSNALKNDAAGREVMMNTLRYWNASYQQFNSEDLLAQQDNKNIWYAQVVGADNGYLTKSSVNGVLRIYNDPGSQYIYKTVAIKNGAFKDNKNLKAVEFYQTNGLSDNSYSDLKIVIQNGAFQGCTNLKELRMFYYVEDGEDHWEVLGPKDVIPGNNIFGIPSAEEIEQMSNEELRNRYSMPEDFRILVYTERYKDFLDDPNWAPYIGYIEPVDYLSVEEQNGDEASFQISDHKGIIYGYMVSPGSIRQTSSTVSQDVSWWTIPRIIIEAATYIIGIGVPTMVWNFAPHLWPVVSQLVDVLAPCQFALQMTDLAISSLQSYDIIVKKSMYQLANTPTNSDAHKNSVREAIYSFVNSEYGKQDNFKKLPDNLRLPLIEKGLIDNNGHWKITESELTTFLNDETNSAWLERIFIDVLKYFNTDIANRMSMQESELAATQRSIRSILSKTSHIFAKEDVWASMPYAGKQAVNSAYFATTTWGGKGRYDSDALNKAVRNNILSNINQVGLVGGGFIITTPQKNLVYHTYVKEVLDSVTHAVIHAGTDKDQGKNASARTITFAKNAFHNKKNLQYVSFFENNVSTNEAIPMVLTIPDSAFVGCDNLKEFCLILQTDGNGTQALGPESFILAGDNVFAGLDPERFHIVIDPSRKEDFLINDSWAPLEKYFSYREAKPNVEYYEYGGQYAYAYDNGSVQRVNKVNGHKIEHTVVIGPDNDFLDNHKGAIKLCNDIGVYNNFQLDAVYHGAFKNNQNLRRVLFTDLKGSTGFGDVYTDLDVTLQDSCFANCKNLSSIDLVYLVTDGTNHFTPITPQMLKIGKGALAGTTTRLKMMPQQVAWFEADSTWVQYRDRFMPCIIKPVDEGVKEALEFLTFTDDAATQTDDTTWDDYIDLSRLPIGGDGYDYSKLDGKFREEKDDLRSFPDFKQFESLGMKTIRASWFEGCHRLSNILLPATTNTIDTRAFKGCSALTEIDIPENVSVIKEEALSGCSSLKAIYVHNKTPFTLSGCPLPQNSGMRIYVPDASVQAYKQNWVEYAPYIYGESQRPLVGKVVTVTETGQLADKLGLTPVKSMGKIFRLDGLYAQYDSLTVIGPLNGDDLAVLRHLGGADAYDSDPTDGRLTYLNLWDAVIRKDSEHSYNGNGMDEYIDADNKVPDYLFENCTSLQTVILPKTATYIGENIFEDATGLRRVVVGLNTTEYECDILQSLASIDELALLTNNHATSTYKDPWEADIAQAYVPKSLLGDYLGDYYLIQRAHNVIAPFVDDTVWKALADKRLFFPDEYTALASAEDIFNGNTYIRNFDEFQQLISVKALENTFEGCASLERITLPPFVERIDANAFAGCCRLATIRLYCDTVPKLAPDAFEDLPSDFRILVPKNLCMLYREKWEQYADHINPDESYYAKDDIIVVRTTSPNTLAEKLGLNAFAKTEVAGYNSKPWVYSVSGDYSKITKIKVIGPISALDFDVMRYLAGYCPWIQKHNYSGRLEYIDLYDAQIVETETQLRGESDAFEDHKPKAKEVSANALPYHAFLKAYSLKTLILPKTCKKVEARALQECSNLEILVLGDDMEDFNWNALDDDVSLTRMYILANKVVNISSQWAVWRWLCNNYNPTFDAFYVRPSLLEQYRSNSDYTSSSWHRTNNIQKGIFDEDEDFCAFAAHAAATEDDLSTVYDIKGWFDSHPNVTDLTPLGFTAIDSLRTEDMAPLNNLKKIVLPITTKYIGKDVFKDKADLRYVDMLMCDTDLTGSLKGGIRDHLGLNPYALAYVPVSYGETDEPNVVWGTDNASLRSSNFILNDSWDYYVPYAFTTSHVDNTRTLTPRAGLTSSKYTTFLPYGLPTPDGATAYLLTKREGTTLVFKQVYGMEPLTPYLVVTGAHDVSLSSDQEQQIPTYQQATAAIGQSQINVSHYSLRGTTTTIKNQTAAGMGAFIMQADNLWHRVKKTEGYTAAYIPPYRAFILESAGPTGINTLSMELIDDADGIDSILTIDHDGTERWYDLNGRELPGKPQHGIYIHNGKKHAK